jgi:ubiquinone/menaquinone biosynthesis C-methylase UbiE
MPLSNQPRDNMPVHYSAQAYDHFTSSFLGRFDDLLVTRVRQEVRANPVGRRFLDAGCGTARFLLRLASIPELSSLSLIGLDYFEDMLEVSRRNVRREALGDRIEIVQGDMHCLPFDSASFDFVVSRSTLHHLADPATALIEIRRCLAPGGVALIHEVRRDADPQATAMFNRFRKQAGVEPSRSEEKYTIEEIRGFVRKSNLGDEATVLAPSNGYASLGCEIRIAAPR